MKSSSGDSGLALSAGTTAAGAVTGKIKNNTKITNLKRLANLKKSFFFYFNVLKAGPHRVSNSG